MIYTIVTVFLLCTIILSMLSYVFNSSEKEAYENLHLETQEIKNDIKLQMISDRENLVTMANFAAKLHNEGEDLDIMFQAFEKIGLIDNIGILLPDNRFITKV